MDKPESMTASLPYEVDLERYHEYVFSQQRTAEKLARKGIAMKVPALDDLTKRARKMFDLHYRIKKSGKRSPAFPKIVTEKNLFAWWQKARPLIASL
jgi:hypothetical protein